MNAVDYLKEKARMTDGCKEFITCRTCKLSSYNNCEKIICRIFEQKHSEKAVEIVKNWAKEHPVKTYLSVLLEKLPNVKLNEDGVPDKFCPNEIYGDKWWDGCFQVGGRGNCVECWNREYKEEK